MPKSKNDMLIIALLIFFNHSRGYLVKTQSVEDLESTVKSPVSTTLSLEMISSKPHILKK